MHRVIATQTVHAGGEVLEFIGELVDRPSKYSLQVGEDLHLLAPEGEPWRYLNHSCDPNARMAGMKLLALRDIAPGDEVTFDYNTTEWAMATPFTCGCGACDGRLIAGFSRLSPREQADLEPRLADHLKDRARLKERARGS